MSSPAVLPPRVANLLVAPPADDAPLLQRLRYYLNPLDGRYEDLWKGDWRLNVARDFAAGLIVAMVAIPLAMGFAMASGLRPEQGIVGGAVAGFVGAMWGGSKYQVYGPTAAFIPVIGAMMVKYDHGMLVLASVFSGAILLLLGVARLGRIVAKVPHSIIVGFTIGIAVTIALSQIGEVLGIRATLGYSFFDKVRGVAANAGDINAAAIALGVGTFLITKYLLKITPYLPAPLIAIGATTAMAATVWRDVDFSQRSADALGVATSIAAAAGSLAAHAMHVRFDPSRAAPDDRESIAVGREHEAFETFSARVDLHDVDVQFLCEQGHDVARTILHVASTIGANLVVMGTRGRTRAASLLIGSETEHALLWSDVPVLAVKHFGARLKFLEALADARLRQRDNPQFT